MAPPKVGRTVLVTGAAGGLGGAIAQAFAQAGYALILSDLHAAGLASMAGRLAEGGTAVRIEPADLSTRDGAHYLAARCGDADVLINNAALTRMKIQPVTERDDDFWDLTFAIDLLAPIALMQGIVPQMAKRGAGVVINISSVNATRGTVDNAPYAAAKAALEMVSKVSAMEQAMRRTGVRVVCVAPGFVRTPALARHFDGDAAQGEAARAMVPLGRMIEPREVADLCLYLASDAAAAVLGTVVTIDGGMNAGAFTFDSAHYSDD